jgi:hypothetical protein
MYLRLKTGRYAGEVRDVEIRAARVMLADGRAELEFPALVPDAVEEVHPPSRAEAPKNVDSAPVRAPHKGKASRDLRASASRRGGR